MIIVTSVYWDLNFSQMKRAKPFWKKIRIPLPRKKGGFHSGPKGGKGYDRREAKKEAQREIEESQR